MSKYKDYTSLLNAINISKFKSMDKEPDVKKKHLVTKLYKADLL